MKSRAARWSAVLVVAAVTAGVSPAAGAGVTRVEVEAAIREGVRAIRKAQLPNGAWPGQPGTTELATLALLTAGLPADDPDVARALARVSRDGPDAPGYGTYAVSLQTMALAAADPRAYRTVIARNAAWLEQAQIRNMNMNPMRPMPRGGAGSWSYLMQRSGTGDNSNSQYAVLGLNAASEAGVPIAEGVWSSARFYWEGCQQSDGGWAYRVGARGSTGSMTCAGVSSLVITGQRLFRGLESLQGSAIRRCGHGEPDFALKRGVDWLGNHFRVDTNLGGADNWKLYYLYGLERAGRLAGVRYFGEHDWYREGAEELVKTQDRTSGGWQGGGGPLVGTCFAVLFLAKGRAPVLVNKLRHGRGNDWENDRDDVRNLTGLVSRDWKHLLTWQVVDAESTAVEGLLQAPILFMNGHESPKFSEDARRRLRDYVDQGGFLLADACCSRVEFDRGFRALMKDVFPEPQHELKPLPPEHPVWRVRHDLTPDLHPLWGIEIGCRTAVIYSPDDLSCYWNQMENDPAEPAVIVACRVGQNVVEYATGREMPADKLDPREVVTDRAEPPRRGALHIAKLRHASDWNVAPMSVPHLTTALRDRSGLDVVINHHELLPSDPNLVNFPLIYLHGRSAFRFGPADLESLRKHLEPGNGTIFADAACGSPPFDAAFRKFVADLLPDRRLEPIPRDDKLYTRAVGYDLSDVRYSKAAGGGQGYPDLEGVKIDGHWAVVYSKYDIGCALERPQGLDCKGYVHESAVRIAANIVLYSTMP